MDLNAYGFGLLLLFSAVEESVAFDEEATNRGPAKNVPIKAHGHSPEAEGSGGSSLLPLR